jgi:Protein of unknown function (DUF2865)
MDKRSGKIAVGAAMILSVAAIASVAQAQDFFSGFFGPFGARRPQPSMTPPPYAGGESTVVMPENSARRRRHSHSDGSQAYCVRGCDGRYFPISGPNNQSRAASCSSFCPASETNVVYGSNIDSAVTEGGKPYSELPNAYRYRDELVAGCTCNGKDTVGLAAVKLEDDPTLRRGDIVARKNGLMVAGRSADRRGASLDLSPAPRSVRSHYRRVPIVAAQ